MNWGYERERKGVGKRRTVGGKQVFWRKCLCVPFHFTIGSRMANMGWRKSSLATIFSLSSENLAFYFGFCQAFHDGCGQSHPYDS